MVGTKSQGRSVVIAASAIQLIVGIAYVWSIFQTGVADSLFGGDNAAAGLTFSILLAILSLGSIAGGRLATAYSTRLVVFIGGLILASGFFLASFTQPEFAWLLWVTYGGMGGIGMGFLYSTTIACVQQWYPEKKGLVTGIIVAALGLGGVVFTYPIEMLIVHFGGQGVGEPNTFIALSILFLVVCTIGSLFMRDPIPAEEEVSTAEKAASVDADSTSEDAPGAATRPKLRRDYTPGEMLKTARFYLTVTIMMLACMGGLMMIAFARPIAFAKGLEATATFGILAIAISNSLGRLFWGTVSDRLGPYRTIIILLAGSGVLSLFMNAAQGIWVFVLIGAIGFLYGGILATFPSLVADQFGPKYMAINYGFVLMGFGGGAIIAAQVGGHFKNIAANDINLMFPAFVIASVLAFSGMGMMFILRMLNQRLTAKTTAT
ncbi:MAG: MFS transporter [Coriobacteriia bacterium]|nr:MFS transporter [Coriobacteriia bacterium]